ncbi:MAG: TOMM precursor leader peptide-binding protein [Luteitalea sp.]|nr:TOMM precursor leader peptide-binding protein [Luteitalea sp.]
MLVIGIRADEPVGRTLGRAFGAALHVLDQPPDAAHPLSANVALAICAASDPAAQEACAAWAQAAHVPALAVIVESGDVLIGPLALPGRPGCGHCARQRIRAAAAACAPPVAEDSEAPSPEGVIARAGRVLVREVRAIVRHGAYASPLLDHVLAVDARTRRTSRHRVVPLSRCRVCGGAATAPATREGDVRRLSSADPPEVVLDALAGWVDRRTGVISRLFVEPSLAASGTLPVVATAAPPHVVADDGSLQGLPIGWGKGLTVSEAILSAVGEAIERYAPSTPDPTRLVWARSDDLDGEWLDPRACALYTEAQYAREGFPYVRFDPTVRHPWVLGRWLGRDTPVWVPAVFAFLSLTLRPEHLICQGTSNGLAAATHPDEAALRATLELVERDAFMTAWLTAAGGSRSQRVDARTLDPRMRGVLDGLAALGASVELYVLQTSACAATALALGLGDGERWPGVTIGLGADFDPRTALQQALLELGQTGPHLQRLMRSGLLPAPDRPSQVQEMLHHAAYYFPTERAAAFDRMRAGEPTLTVHDLTERVAERSLARCARDLEVAGIRVALIDVTSPDVATGPFRVIRAISPDLQPISYGYGLDRQPVARLLARGLASPIPHVHPIW